MKTSCIQTDTHACTWQLLLTIYVHDLCILQHTISVFFAPVARVCGGGGGGGGGVEGWPYHIGHAAVIVWSRTLCTWI